MSTWLPLLTPLIAAIVGAMATLATTRLSRRRIHLDADSIRLDLEISDQVSDRELGLWTREYAEIRLRRMLISETRPRIGRQRVAFAWFSFAWSAFYVPLYQWLILSSRDEMIEQIFRETQFAFWMGVALGLMLNYALWKILPSREVRARGVGKGGRSAYSRAVTELRSKLATKIDAIPSGAGSTGTTRVQAGKHLEDPRGYREIKLRLQAEFSK